MITVGQGPMTCSGLGPRPPPLGGLGLGSLGFCPPACAGSGHLNRRGAFGDLASAGRRPEPARDLGPQAGRPRRSAARSIDRDPLSRASEFASTCPGWRRGWIAWRWFDRVAPEAAPIHETGHQLLQTGALCRAGEEAPHFGSVIARLHGSPERSAAVRPPSRPIAATGSTSPTGSVAWLGSPCRPFSPALETRRLGLRRTVGLRIPLDAQLGRLEPASRRAAMRLTWRTSPRAFRDAYGRTTFGQSCLLARRLVEAGVRVVTVNMFRDRLQPGHLGLPRRGAVQHARRLRHGCCCRLSTGLLRP